ncbi:MAG: site-specific integrase [Proteobacteria bacterium]|uniref:tyrosine-type recombinase/integrase n=1 Tax=Aquabacterium sp. TaxID=1872578 RepID=UPI0026065741|nr:site-specific integrase [uncultured Aquabacterium sp.]MCH8179279.1 site-specific integrase [Pseudomonadota bacterium]
MAKPYREPATRKWSFRLRVRGEDIYRTGFQTEAEARKAQEALKQSLKAPHRPALDGPWKTTLAQALFDYAQERLPGLKSGEQESRRINRYLRLAQAPTLRLAPVQSTGTGEQGAQAIVYWSVRCEPPSELRRIPQGLSRHRDALSRRSEKSDRIRQRLAISNVADITAHDVQSLIDAMVEEGASAATVRLEHAVLRQFFNYARDTWKWKLAEGNPATRRKLPTVDNGRDRVLTNREWSRVCEALETTRNPYVPLALALLLESAMRCSEALVHVTWRDFEAENCLLRLRSAKAGKRAVPLSPGALEVMQQLRKHAESLGPVSADSRVFLLTYEALKAAWKRACERAEVEGVRLHDLRHTSATRFALELNGNMPVLKVITGHKTDSQLLRYVNIKAEDVSRLLHGRPLDHDDAPAGLRVIRAEIVRPLRNAPTPDIENMPPNVVALSPRPRR